MGREGRRKGAVNSSTESEAVLRLAATHVWRPSCSSSLTCVLVHAGTSVMRHRFILFEISGVDTGPLLFYVIQICHKNKHL